MSEETTQERIARIIAAFEAQDDGYRRAEMDEAVALRDEIVPALLELLDRVVQDPWSFAADEEYQGHLYAVELLSFFRESRAHPIILRLFSLPRDLVDDLFGDVITEDLPMILFNTCGGDLTGIKALLANKDAYVFSRLAAAHALAYATVDGLATREETMGLLGSLLAAPDGDDPEMLAGGLIGTMTDLGPEGYMDVIRQAFAADLVDLLFIDLDYVEQVHAAGPEAGWQEIRDDMARRRPESVHDLMEWWAGFQEPSVPATDTPLQLPPPPPTLRPLAEPARKAKAAKKRARKQAKASRRRNRK